MPRLSFHAKHKAVSCCNVQPDMNRERTKKDEK